MGLWFRHPHADQWLSRAGTGCVSLSEPFDSLVPPGTEVPYEQVRDSLSGQILSQLPFAWGWDESLLTWVFFANAEAARQIDDAVQAGLLTLRIVLPVPEARTQSQRRLLGGIWMFARHAVRRADSSPKQSA